MDELERRHKRRHEICHPIKIHIVSPEWVRYGLPPRYDGFVNDVSIGGMSINLDDSYNPLNIEDLLGKRLKIEINIPSTGQRVFLLGVVRWGTREGQAKHMLMMGIEFVEMMDFHLTNLEQLFTVNAKDHNMLWNLWDTLEIKQ